MIVGAEYHLDPISIIGDGPSKRGIFADTSYDELFGENEFSLPKPDAGHLLLLALLAGGIYLAVKS